MRVLSQQFRVCENPMVQQSALSYRLRPHFSGQLGLARSRCMEQRGGMGLTYPGAMPPAWLLLWPARSGSGQCTARQHQLQTSQRLAGSGLRGWTCMHGPQRRTRPAQARRHCITVSNLQDEQQLQMQSKANERKAKTEQGNLSAPHPRPGACAYCCCR